MMTVDCGLKDANQVFLFKTTNAMDLKGSSIGFTRKPSSYAGSYQSRSDLNKNWRLEQIETSKNMESNSRSDLNPEVASNNVTKFFSAYKHQMAPPPMQHGDRSMASARPFSGKPQYQRFPPHHQNQMPEKRTANSEFQAMWNHLQNQKLPQNHRLAPQQPDSFTFEVTEQTNALRKILKLNEDIQDKQRKEGFQQPKLLHGIPKEQHHTSFHQPNAPVSLMPKLQIGPNFNPQGTPPPNRPFPDLEAKSCGHKNCCEELTSLCQLIGMTYPVYNYIDNKQSNAILCILIFSDGQELTGPWCSTRMKASEAIACQAIKLIQNKYHLMPPRQPPPLPSPPQQWCQGSNQDSKAQEIKPINLNIRNEFVPHQVQKSLLNSSKAPGKQTKKYEVPIIEPTGFVSSAVNRKDIVKPIPQSPPKQADPAKQKRRSEGSGRGRRRIAANFSIPIDK